MAKTIIFDLGGVFFEADWDSINKELLAKTGVPIFPQNGGRYDFYVDFALGKINAEEYFSKLIKAINSTAKISDISAAYKQAYINNTKIDPRMLKLSESLHKRYRLICITNTNEFHKEINVMRGLFSNFDAVFSSFEMGKIKRKNDLFLEVLQKLSLKPEDCIFVDDKEENIVSANSIGIDAIQFKGYEQLVGDLKNRKII